MSAFIMPENELNTIISYFITPVLDNQLYAEIGFHGFTYMGIEEARTAANILHEANVVSVEYRYESKESHEFRFSFIRDAHRRPIGNIAGALDCLEYQSCEDPDFYQSPAYKLITAMRKHLLKKASGEDYTWGIE